MFNKKQKIITEHGVFYYYIDIFEPYSFNGLFLYKKRYLNLILFKIPYYINLSKGCGNDSGVLG